MMNGFVDSCAGAKKEEAVRLVAVTEENEMKDMKSIYRVFIKYCVFLDLDFRIFRILVCLCFPWCQFVYTHTGR